MDAAAAAVTVYGPERHEEAELRLPRITGGTPTGEGFSASPPAPRTTASAATTAASTAKGQGDSTAAGADPRDGRDPFEESGGPGTAEPTAAELPPPTPRRFCEETRRRAIDWPQTHTGSSVERPCPKGTRGRPAGCLTRTDAV
ncbi:Adhesion G protein-coupled receptor L2 [Liparis tanakae]|uniref:Adhesion G protein-coupled receptor L2 n=1 Tax=Liparis tanakae TaxID=230148 RepID=A0A4Z2DZT6_9TELE|nr:Adhesion G protein-coupled receptor L2 [Liparis tanakae]